MTPELTVRSFTNDQFHLDKVFYTNYYGIKGFKEGEFRPVVVDIGAHCGYFTFNAAACGARTIYSFEPCPENYRILLQNVATLPLCPVQTYQLGVSIAGPMVMKLAYPELKSGMYFDYANFEEKGKRLFPFQAISLDDILDDFVSEQVDILKINIGYAERHILATNILDKTPRYVCGESDIDDKGIADLKSTMFKKGYLHSSFKKSESEEGKVLFHFGVEELSKVFNI